MRLFVALEIEEPVRRELGRRCDELKKRLNGRISWVPPEKMHITLKFIGEVSQDRAPKIVDAISGIEAAVCPFAPEGWGAFPNEKRPNVLWAGVENCEKNGMAALAKAVEDRLQYIDIPAEGKPFRGHITLARLKEPVRGVPEAFASCPLERLAETVPQRFVLMESRLEPTGSVYIERAAFPLQR